MALRPYVWHQKCNQHNSVLFTWCQSKTVFIGHISLIHVQWYFLIHVIRHVSLKNMFVVMNIFRKKLFNVKHTGPTSWSWKSMCSRTFYHRFILFYWFLFLLPFLDGKKKKKNLWVFRVGRSFLLRVSELSQISRGSQSVRRGPLHNQAWLGHQVGAS